MKYSISAPMESGRGRWMVWLWRGSLSKHGRDNRMIAYGDSRVQALDRALKLRRCLR